MILQVLPAVNLKLAATITNISGVSRIEILCGWFNPFSEFDMSKSALIFGASGVTGWAFVNEILNDYPRKGTWGKVHALTNRPLKQSDSFWPNDERLNIVSGIDLLKGSQEELEDALRKIEGIEEVTYVYYLGKTARPEQSFKS